MKKFLISGSAAVIAMTGFALAAPVTIDTFQTEQSVTFRPDGGVDARSEIEASEAIGGFRDMEAITTGENEKDGGTSGDVNIFGALDLALSNDAGIEGEVRVIYDGEGDEGLGGVNLIPDGENTGFIFEIPSADDTAEITFTVVDTNGMSSVYTTNVVEAQVGTRLFAAFEDFSGSADFTSVDLIELVLGTGIAGDITLESITAGTLPIPVPAAAPLFLAGVAGFSALRRRKKA